MYETAVWDEAIGFSGDDLMFAITSRRSRW